MAGEGELLKASADALITLDAARKEAEKIAWTVRKVSAGLGDHFPTFLAVNFGQGSPGYDQHRARDVRVDLDAWPTVDRLREVLLAWHGAFTRAHEAWQAIPEPYRSLAPKPPERMTLA